MTMDLNRRQLALGLAALLAGTSLVPAPARATMAAIPQDIAGLGAPDRALETRVAELAARLPKARVGFAAADLVGGRTAFLREGEAFPMLGVNALPLAVAILRLAEQGTLDLDALVRLTQADIAPGRSPLAARLREKPVRFTLRQLVEHALLNGDTTAMDALLRQAGGPARVHATLVRVGLREGLRIDRYERDLQPAVFGLKPARALADPDAFGAAVQALGPGRRRQALGLFLADPRDKASPQALAALHARLMSGYLLDRQGTNFILDLMRRTRAGAGRLDAGMGKGWTLAHRSGQSRSLDGRTAVFNDTGIAFGPAGQRIAIALFIQGDDLAVEALEALHRDVAAAVISAWEPRARA